MEGFPKQERVEKEAVLEALKTKGFEDPETKALVEKWTDEREQEVARDPHDKAAPIKFTIDRADLYIAIGDIEGALECLDDARMQAQQEGNEALYDEAMRKMEELG